MISTLPSVGPVEDENHVTSKPPIYCLADTYGGHVVSVPPEWNNLVTPSNSKLFSRFISSIRSRWNGAIVFHLLDDGPAGSSGWRRLFSERSTWRGDSHDYFVSSLSAKAAAWQPGRRWSDRFVPHVPLSLAKWVGFLGWAASGIPSVNSYESRTDLQSGRIDKSNCCLYTWSN